MTPKKARLERRSAVEEESRSGQALVSSCWITLAGFAPGPVHLVDECNARARVSDFICRSYGFGCGCTPATASKHSNHAIQHAERKRSTSTVKSTWPGSVNDVDIVIVPMGSGGGGSDRDSALALQLHMIHHGPLTLDFLDRSGYGLSNTTPLSVNVVLCPNRYSAEIPIFRTLRRFSMFRYTLRELSSTGWNALQTSYEPHVDNIRLRSDQPFVPEKG